MSGIDIKLGERYRDEVTGFVGTATARYEFVTGCIRYLLEGPNSKGDPAEYVFDEDRLRTLKDSKPEGEPRSGGPRDVPGGRTAGPRSPR